MLPAPAEQDIYELVGVSIPACLALIAALEEGLYPPAFGHVQLAALSDPLVIATASDEVMQAARTIATNVVEMRLHESGASKALADARAGVSRDPETRETLAVVRAEVDMHIAGFFRAAGSALDCLAAVAIVILQAPLKVRRADANELGGLGKGKQRRAAASPSQVQEWDDFDALIAASRASSPVGWYEWAMDTRNAVIHRGRKIRIFVQVPATGSYQLLVATDDQIGAMMALGKFDLHLPRNPEAADMSDLILGASVSNAILAENAQITLRGVHENVVALIEASCAFLLRAWKAPRSGWNIPGAAWELEPVAKAQQFGGFAGDTRLLTGDSMVINPVEGRRVEIAQRVRAARGLQP